MIVVRDGGFAPTVEVTTADRVCEVWKLFFAFRISLPFNF